MALINPFYILAENEIKKERTEEETELFHQTPGTFNSQQNRTIPYFQENELPNRGLSIGERPYTSEQYNHQFPQYIPPKALKRPCSNEIPIARNTAACQYRGNDSDQSKKQITRSHSDPDQYGYQFPQRIPPEALKNPCLNEVSIAKTTMAGQHQSNNSGKSRKQIKHAPERETPFRLDQYGNQFPLSTPTEAPKRPCSNEIPIARNFRVCQYQGNSFGQSRKQITRAAEGETPLKLDQNGNHLQQYTPLEALKRPCSSELPIANNTTAGQRQSNNCGKSRNQITQVLPGEKSFKCDQCNRHFARRDTLRSHGKTHTGEKPYICEYCNRSFARSDTLKIHGRTHTGEKPYACDQCSFRSARSDGLSSHKRRRHSSSE